MRPVLLLGKQMEPALVWMVFSPRCPRMPPATERPSQGRACPARVPPHWPTCEPPHHCCSWRACLKQQWQCWSLSRALAELTTSSTSLSIILFLMFILVSDLNRQPANVSSPSVPATTGSWQGSASGWGGPFVSQSWGLLFLGHEQVLASPTHFSKCFNDVSLLDLFMH